MEASRRQLTLLGAILVVLAGVVYWQATRTEEMPAAVVASRAASAPPAGPAAPRAGGASVIPAVAMADLDRPQPEPADTGRDPFRFGTAEDRTSSGGSAPRGGRSGLGPAAMPLPAGPVAPPGPPPIVLKFIGTARQGEAGRLYAVLRDDRGVYYGAEGDVVEGLYRILRVTADVVDVSYVDGRGRTSIPLSGGRP